MESSQPEAENDSVFGGPVHQAMLAIAFVVVGIALFYSLNVGDIELLRLVLLALFGLIAISWRVFYTPGSQ